MKLFNTLTRQIEEVKPLEGRKIKLYVCGLTVYSQPHIGNWVAYIYWDVLVRTLKVSGFDVTHVQNITDVGHLTSDEDAGEDKMLKGALKEGKTAWEVADKYIKIADEEAKALGLLRPDHMPRATEYIDQQKAFVEELHAKGFTYVIDDGIYFDTSKTKNYGELAKLDIEGLQFGARVADTGKKNPTDFAVWKFSDAKEKRDMEWDSPVEKNRKGFPGWHLECSVMARELLGDQIDIHTGGIDHIPVHHTNEIAQTEALTNKSFSQMWVHANHIKVDGTKISKSLGNGYTLTDIQDKGYDLQAFKLMVLSKHYTTEGNFTWGNLDAAQKKLKDYRAMADLVFQPHQKESGRGVFKVHIDHYIDSITSALGKDLNTPEAIKIVNESVADLLHFGIEEKQLNELVRYLKFLDSIMNLDLSNREDINPKQRKLLKEREEAKQARDFDKSDDIRKQLEDEHKIFIQDTYDNRQIWYRVS